jgi:hypothetical protein
VPRLAGCGPAHVSEFSPTSGAAAPSRAVIRRAFGLSPPAAPLLGCSAAGSGLRLSLAAASPPGALLTRNWSKLGNHHSVANSEASAARASDPDRKRVFVEQSGGFCAVRSDGPMSERGLQGARR